MTEHKFTDEEVIKSLKVCLEGDNCKECYINPHHGNYGYCTSLALKETLDLINRQKAEIAFWQDAAANARREILLEIESLALSKIPEDVEVTMLKDTYYIEALDELMIKYGVTDKNVGCNKEEMLCEK